jgi:putative flippase GtrA
MNGNLNNLIQKIRHSQEVVSAARFALVGLLGTTVDVCVFITLQMIFHLPILAANTISYSTGIANNFYLHRRWTFASRPRRLASQQLAMFVLVSLAALALNNLVVYLLTPALQASLENRVLANLLAKTSAIAAGLGWNFLANHLWTFRN